MTKAGRARPAPRRWACRGGQSASGSRPRGWGGREALRRRPRGRTAPRLSAEQRAQVPHLLAQGAEAHGFLGAVWTTARVAAVIRREFGVRHHPAHVRRILTAIRWTPRQPRQRSIQRAEAQLAALRAERPPARQATPRPRGARPCTSTNPGAPPCRWWRGRMRRAGRRRCCAPRSRAHRAVLGAVTADGRRFPYSQAAAVTGTTVVAFLRQLPRQLRGTLLVVWDGAPMHRCTVVKAFLAKGAAARLHRERLPADAPDLNPAEGVWNLRKRGELTNRCCQTLDELGWEPRLAIRRRQRQRHRVRGCVAQCGHV